MDRTAVAERLARLAEGLVAGQMDRALFNLYSKYERKPYFMYTFELKDPFGNPRQLWARFFIEHGQHLVVRYDLVGGSGMPHAMENMGLKRGLPEDKVEIDDSLEERLLTAGTTRERGRVIEMAFGSGFSGRIADAVNTGFDKVLRVSEKSF